jgi:hypothetical protein
MSLETFVTQTLTQIVKGVQGAQDALPDGHTIVNPKMRSSSDQLRETTHKDRAQIVRFDVAITATKQAGKNGGVSVAAAVFTVGGHLHSAEQNASISRVQFSVPLALPTSEKSK